MFLSKQANTPIESKVNALVGRFGLILGILCIPYLFDKFIALSPLFANEVRNLWIFSAVLITISSLLIVMRNRVLPKRSLSYFGGLLYLSLEFLFRIYFNILGNHHTVAELIKLNYRTYNTHSAFVGHPFLQFTGRPSIEYEGNEALGNIGAFNKFGFPGREYEYRKRDGAIRIIAMGESTTADGWPSLLEDKLNKQRNNDKYYYEVLTFAMGAWNSAHSLVNFVLNVTEFDPDYILLHHGWNELGVRNALKEEFRTDYSHALNYYQDPSIYDKYLIRWSVLYRYLKLKIDPAPQWSFLFSSIEKEREQLKPFYHNLSELKPFKRNIKTIIDLALLNNIKVILTTIPHSTDPNIPMYYGILSLEQCNDITRGIAQEYDKRIAFIDLDKTMTGKMNHVFKDLGHVNDEGREVKANETQNVLWEMTKNRREILELKDIKDVAPEYIEGTVEYYIRQIKEYDVWLNDIAVEAKKKGKKLDDVILDHAKYMAAQFENEKE